MERARLNIPPDFPKIPEQVPIDNLVAIVYIHHPDAFVVNRDIEFKARVLDEDPTGQNENVLGCCLYLQHVVGRPFYNFGRSKARHMPEAAAQVDVHLPNSRIAVKQFTLAPSREVNCWRVEVASETTMQVNDVPIQKYTNRTMKQHVNMPQALYLDISRVNHVHVHGLQIDIWLIKTVKDILASEPDYHEARLREDLQNIDGRREVWAQRVYIRARDADQVSKISTNSYRMIQRFTGDTVTAKFFYGPHGRLERDREMSIFRAKV